VAGTKYSSHVFHYYIMNKRTSLIALTSLTATFVATTAAFFSVSGIAKLFAGATLSVLIMASSLEFGKIVAISFLYQYWTAIPKLLRTYLTTASTVLMLITSLGIYGFLSGAYQATADQLSIIDQEAQLIELKKKRFQDDLTTTIQERERLSMNIQELSRGLANNQQQYRDAQTGQILTTTSAANRTALQWQIITSTEERTVLNQRIDALSDSVSRLDREILMISMNNDLAAEIGPLRFISNLSGWPIDRVVNMFSLLIVFVFDPLAVALVIAVNFLIKQQPLPDDTTVVSFDTPPNIPTPKPPIIEPVTVSIADTISSSDTPPVELPRTVEPYQIYVPPDLAEKVPPTAQDNELHDPQYFEKDTFDWSKRYLWEHNPNAVRYYYKHVLNIDNQ